MVKCLDCGGGGESLKVKWGHLTPNDDDRVGKWCMDCGVKHGAFDLRLCIDCGLLGRSFGMVSDRRKRWCSVCAAAHPGCFNVKNLTCEDCGTGTRCFGDPNERMKRWCGVCAGKHADSINLSSKMCILCGTGPASYGKALREDEKETPEERKTRAYGASKMGKQPESLWCKKCVLSQTDSTVRVYAV